MRIPTKLLIARMEYYHTHHLGQVNDGRLFWGYETFVFTRPYAEIKDEWQKFRKEYAILHLFDKEGNHLETKYWSGITESDGDKTSMKVEELVSNLGKIKYKDIKVKLFQTPIEGIVFGLVPNLENETINLEPGAIISFEEPWDGEYST